MQGEAGCKVYQQGKELKNSWMCILVSKTMLRFVLTLCGEYILPKVFNILISSMKSFVTDN